jgi:hypothetical protein
MARDRKPPGLAMDDILAACDQVGVEHHLRGRLVHRGRRAR